MFAARGRQCVSSHLSRPVFCARGEAWNARQPVPRIRPHPHQRKLHTSTPHRLWCRHWTLTTWASLDADDC
ncbi:hypothetical protein FJTKL_02086 [Diaporthe vaccinii]|uniref:Uncharacterized protein n=1 Tax=Diaporthe vaccinii TaxID=105482 RepID=A0ABR4DZ12_9PEZI